MAVTRHPARIRMAREEFLQLPEGPPFYEFEDGEVVEVVSPTERHQEVSFLLTLALRRHLQERGLGKVWQALDVHLPTGKIYIPDIVYVSRQRLAQCLSAGDGKIHGVPDLVVEILSPGSVVRDRVEKFGAYLAAGVPWLWLVDPQDLLLEEFQAGPTGYVRTAATAGGPFRPAAFPGLEMDLRGLTD